MMSNTKARRIVSVGAIAAVSIVGCRGIVDPQAKEALLASLGDTSVTVFPAFVREGGDHRYDAAAAANIGQFLGDDGLASATVSDEEVPISGSWRMNQARMLRESAADFAAYVTANPVETDYALLPEYLKGGSGGVGGIHCYVLDAEGIVAWAVLLNSHWEPFADAAPKTADDCTNVLIDVLRSGLKPDDTH